MNNQKTSDPRPEKAKRIEEGNIFNFGFRTSYHFGNKNELIKLIVRSFVAKSRFPLPVMHCKIFVHLQELYNFKINTVTTPYASLTKVTP